MRKETIEGLLEWMKSNWVTYASYAGTNGHGRLEYNANPVNGHITFRAVHDGRVTFEGPNGFAAVDAYNERQP